MLDRDALLRAIAANRRAWFRRRGADPTIRDATYHGIPLGWAEHFGRERVAAMPR